MRLRLLPFFLSLAFLVVPLPAAAAVAFFSTLQDFAHTNTFSIMYTVTSTTTNPTLVVAVFTENATTPDKVTGVTYGSVTVPQLQKLTWTQGTPDESYLFALSGATLATGSNTLTVTLSGAVSFLGVNITSYSGTDQTNTFNSVQCASSTANPSTCSITVAGSSSWVAGTIANNGQAAIALTSTGILRQSGARAAMDTNGIVSAGSFAVTSTNTGANQIVNLILELAAPAVTNTTPQSDSDWSGFGGLIGLGVLPRRQKYTV